MSKKINDIWAGACDHLKEVLSNDDYERWIEVIKCREYSNNHMSLVVPLDFYKEWLEEHYLPLIRKAVSVVSGTEIEISLEVDSQYFPKEKDPEPETHHTITIPSFGSKKKNHNLNPNYTFDSYVVGTNNEFAHAAAMAAATAPARTHNPLFIYGGVGLGKTHLMQAIGNHIISKKPKTNICYTTVETFLNEYVDSIQKGQVSAFRKRYRKVDVLMIDDIHFMDKRKQGLQEEFFHTFNALFEHHKQIIMTSDRTPRELDGLEKRLVSRFAYGLVTELGNPDIETRSAILRKKAEEHNVNINTSILDYIAERVSSDIRNLEGALFRVISYMSLQNRQISIQDIDRLVGDLFDTETQATVNVDIIQRTVAEHFDLRQSDLTGTRRSRDIAWPRQIAMHLSRTMTEQSFPVIGEAFSRNHATILHAHNQISKKAQDDRGLQQTLSILEDKISKNCVKTEV